MKLCPRCNDDVTDEPKDHTTPCRVKSCRSKDHAACEH